MTKHGLKILVSMAWLAAGCWTGYAQAPTVAPAAVAFSYQMGATPLIQQQKVIVTLPKAISGQTVNVTNVTVAMFQNVGTNQCSQNAGQGLQTACGWLSVTPALGASPLTLTVTANPSSLTAGSYSGSFTVANSTAPIYYQQVNVTLSISNPPSQLSPPKDSSGNTITSLVFSYTTGGDRTTLPSATISFTSTGDIIPFTVTAASTAAKGSTASGVWPRVQVQNVTALPATSASSSAFPGSVVVINVTVDYTTVSALDPAGSPYSGTITIAAANPVNGTITIPLTLNVVAGQPRVDSVFPMYVNAVSSTTTTTNNLIFTLIGANFFTTSAVSLQQGHCNAGVGQSYPLPQPAYLSQEVLQVTVNPNYFPVSTIGPWSLYVGNPKASTNPSLGAGCGEFSVVDPTLPTISAVVNAASYQPASVWSGSGADPLAALNVSTSAVSPREIISIFGQNLGPATASTAQPVAVACPGSNDGSTSCSAYDITWGTPAVTVTFSYADPATGGLLQASAPILMTSLNQINAIVPKELDAALGQQITLTVSNNGQPTSPFPLTVLQENPGMFTFGGLGQGQGAIINYDATGTVTSVNSTKNAEPRGDTIAIYVTGMGELTNSAVLTGQLVTDPTNLLADQTVRVDIGGQPCVINYAGTAQGTVAGLVQINAVIPPNAKVGTADTIVVSIGDPKTARSSQSGVAVAVK